MERHRTRSGRRRTAPVSVDGRRYKSRGEAAIADWLLYSGIPFEYEPRYHGNTHGSRYRPDFRVSGTDVYIEYFGTDEDGNVPPYFSLTSGEYAEGIEWKRRIHSENGTHMVELYAWQYSDGTLFARLESALDGLGVHPRPCLVRDDGRGRKRSGILRRHRVDNVR